MVRSDHPCNTKHAGVAICYKDHLPVIGRNDISSLHESIVLEIRLANNAPWTDKNIKSALRKRYRLAKRYYVNGQVQSDYNLLQSHSKKCTEMILSAKNEYMLRVSKN